MNIGYARTSTHDQVAGFDAQLRDLEAVGCKKVFKEQVSSLGQRPQLEALLAYVREEDVVVVTKLDRLARSMSDLLQIIKKIEDKGASLRILGLDFDTSGATGKLVLSIFGGVAEWETAMMKERQKEGIARAKSLGKYKGRAPTAMRKANEVKALAAQGTRPSVIARELKLSRSSVWRILSAQPAAAA